MKPGALMSLATPTTRNRSAEKSHTISWRWQDPEARKQRELSAKDNSVAGISRSRAQEDFWKKEPTAGRSIVKVDDGCAWAPAYCIPCLPDPVLVRSTVEQYRRRWHVPGHKRRLLSAAPRAEGSSRIEGSRVLPTSDSRSYNKAVSVLMQ